jgi:hypothetical protein
MMNRGTPMTKETSINIVYLMYIPIFPSKSSRRSIPEAFVLPPEMSLPERLQRDLELSAEAVPGETCHRKNTTWIDS